MVVAINPKNYTTIHMPKNYSHQLNLNFEPKLNETNKSMEVMVFLLSFCLVYPHEPFPTPNERNRKNECIWWHQCANPNFPQNSH